MPSWWWRGGPRRLTPPADIVDREINAPLQGLQGFRALFNRTQACGCLQPGLCYRRRFADGFCDFKGVAVGVGDDDVPQAPGLNLGVLADVAPPCWSRS